MRLSFFFLLLTGSMLLFMSCGDEEFQLDCRFEERACATGFMCVESDSGWDCIAESVIVPESGGQPRLILRSPVPNQEVGDQLPIRVEVSNFSLVPYWSSTHVVGQGHMHIYIDGSPIVPDDQGIVETNLNVMVTGLADVEPTNHTLRIVVENNDNTLHDVIQPIELQWIKLPNS